ncbi:MULTISPECIES: acyl-CoA dehydrogenase family protein [unclassified Microbacterium]|jgi:alkylation response protein AidB-like acyl-CoA dehydrogenase|uniref:acyl-CoA dehydrogenase family protein n=1 Tax=unclassified Microbacterium TaxID=2609290 RepID=UPI000CFCF57F|nr:MULTISPECIES: acyl-CoA dehydrogenase family protein [unclassified Microbacterium]PQZ49946.1 acyl-CoA dehydrogenase [Microbacterium sp. MYb43]PQZ72310.1 acyl-CoA dehydrogenase [Microbacterium sp. MYb40]PRB14376.1 acyl-CoA dehydrogenase [Microbacterium sp. MYb54]PRB20956.1 acyl-CoA dehydrogenase [Microbacterium sp. MYb50]PRB58939.1 acyl-CoA dehydrogenase [Microbacterium sp. MYb24]
MTMTTVTTTAEEREAILDAVREFAESELAPFAAERDEKHLFPRESLNRGGELGLGGIYVREEFGGTGLSRIDTVAIFEELAKADPAVAAYISIHNMVVWMIDTYGDDTQRGRWLPKLTAMSEFGGYCLTEPGAGSDAANIATSAVRDGDDYVLTGVKQFISGAGEAAVYVVMARTGEPGARGISAFLVPGDAEGLSFGALEKKMGWHAQPTRQVIFDGLRVPASAMLGDEGRGFAIAMSALNGGRLNIAACSLGGAEWALDRAVQYVHERVAFGEPLAEKQSILFAIADMRTQLHAARLMVRDGAQAVDEHAPDATMRCAMAKRFATDAGFDVANRALQLHGGYGYLQDYGIEKVVRDLRVHQILEGTNEIMRLIVGREMLRPAGSASLQRSGGDQMRSAS